MDDRLTGQPEPSSDALSELTGRLSWPRPVQQRVRSVNSTTARAASYKYMGVPTWRVDDRGT